MRGDTREEVCNRELFVKRNGLFNQIDEWETFTVAAVLFIRSQIMNIQVPKMKLTVGAYKSLPAFHAALRATKVAQTRQCMLRAQDDIAQGSIEVCKAAPTLYP